MELPKIIKHKNTIWRLLLVCLLAIPLVFAVEFYHHFYLYLSGANIVRIVTKQWHLVIVNVLLFLSFLIPLSYRRKTGWSEYGLVTAFFVSLFVEMYGFPFTLVFVSKFFSSPAMLPRHLISFSFLGVHLGMDLGMIYGAIIMTIGMGLVMIGWITLYKNSKNKGLVTNGIYSYSRHPQYLGFILVILGWLMGWPTIITVIFSVILIYKYVTVGRIEEREVVKDFPEYVNYSKRVPFLI